MEDESYPPGIQKIVDRIPEVWGKWISCDSGWFPLLIELDEKLAQIAPDYEVSQVKEKFGTLRYYFTLDIELDDQYKQMQKIVDEYEHRSGSICELCGGNGSMRVQNRWCKTLCDECAEQNGYGRADNER